MTSKQQWLDKVTADLKGKDINSLDWKINTDWSVSPFGHPDDMISQTPLAPQDHNHWTIVETVNINKYEPAEANAILLQALYGGASGITIHTDYVLEPSDWEILLKDIQLDMIHLSIELSDQRHYTATISQIAEYLKQQKIDVSALNIRVICDQTDVLDRSYPKASLINSYKALPNIKVLGIHTDEYYEGHTEVVSELSDIASIIVDIIDHYQAFDIDATTVLEAIDISLHLDDAFLLNIAKIRALRWITGTIANAYDATVSAIPIEARIAHQVWTTDNNTNRIKASAIAASAIIAGTDRLKIDHREWPTTDKSGEEFSRRINRNISNILSMESYMDQVSDPTAGSYYIEKLTQELSEKSWALFQSKWSKKSKS